MKRISFFLLILLFFLSSCEKFKITRFRSDWKKSPDAVWIGPDLWANRLQDWVIKSGKLECISNLPMRTVHLITRSISDKRGVLNISVNIFQSKNGNPDPESAAGVLVGAGRGLDYRTASLIFDSWGELAGVFIGLDSRGNLFLRDFEKENYYYIYDKKNDTKWKEAKVLINITPGKDKYRIKVLAVNPFTNIIIDKLEYDEIPDERLIGNIALVAHTGIGRKDPSGFSFTDWKVSGSKITKNTERTIGPIISAQYTLSKNIVKITAQIMPLGEDENKEVILEMKEGDKWVQESVANFVKPSYTALFRIKDWTIKEDIDYRITYKLKSLKNKPYYLYGIIKHDPVDKGEIKMISLSGSAHIFKSDNYRTILYPHNKLIDNLKKIKADILFFTGDPQPDEISGVSENISFDRKLDFLYNWYLWCLTFKDLTSTTPTIIIPSDPDRYYDNSSEPVSNTVSSVSTDTAFLELSARKISPEFIKMVRKVETGHLPDPFDNEPSGRGMGTYYTDCNIGGLSLAILEDKIFKSNPQDLLPAAKIFNGKPHNADWNVRYNSRIENAVLLGERQKAFLEKWASDWSYQAWMKIALSQSLLCNLSTIPEDSTNLYLFPDTLKPQLMASVSRSRLATDFNSNGWPQNERDNTIKILRKAFAVHIVGDQHLGSTLQYGVDNFRDAGFAIVTPPIANITPTMWLPGIRGLNRMPQWPDNYGDFEDGFGNKITLFALANPTKSGYDSAVYFKALKGFSIIKFNRNTHEIDIANYPYAADPEKDKPIPYWPVKISQLDNYGRAVAGWLPEVRVEGINNPVIKIIKEFTDELIYSIRINGKSFQPEVFEMGNYRIEIGEPDLNKWQKLEKVYPTPFKEREPVTIKF